MSESGAAVHFALPIRVCQLDVARPVRFEAVLVCLATHDEPLAVDDRQVSASPPQGMAYTMPLAQSPPKGGRYCFGAVSNGALCSALEQRVRGEALQCQAVPLAGKQLAGASRGCAHHSPSLRRR